jgi:hypothetical protein
VKSSDVIEEEKGGEGGVWQPARDVEENENEEGRPRVMELQLWQQRDRGSWVGHSGSQGVAG